MSMGQPIGSFEAKSQLSRLLRAVERGERFTITVRGRPVAELVPCEASSQGAIEEAAEAMRRFPRIQGVADRDVASFIGEGRE
jgi:prevent-host-death family protein